MMRPQASTNGVRFTCDACDETLVVHADAEKAEQVLLNLVANAVKFTPAGGEVSVTAEIVDVNSRRTISGVRSARSASARHLVHQYRRKAAWFAAVLMSARGIAAQSTRSVQPDSVRVPILVYHSVMPHHPGQTAEQRILDVDDSVFVEQMSYLVEGGYHVVPFAALVDALEGHGRLPRRAVVITFDDGWGNQYRHAFPILRRFGLTATFFVFTTPIGVDAKLMTWDELRELQAAGMTIGSHTRTHPVLPRYHAALHNEVAMSREDIAKHLGRAPEFFAYPFGQWDAESEAWARRAGYRAARAYRGGAWNAASDQYHLRAVPVTDDMRKFKRAVPDS